jgi:site-specific DNA-cytosine methylase
MAVVIEALVKRGYRIAYRVCDAQFYGVPQRRRRVFIVGCLGDTGRSPEEILAIGESRARYLEASKSKRKDAPTATSEGVGGSGELTGTLLARDYKGADESKLVVSDPVWWDGSDVAASLTVTSNEQRMPDKGRLQVVITDVVHES